MTTRTPQTAKMTAAAAKNVATTNGMMNTVFISIRLRSILVGVDRLFDQQIHSGRYSQDGSNQHAPGIAMKFPIDPGSDQGSQTRADGNFRSQASQADPFRIILLGHQSAPQPTS